MKNLFIKLVVFVTLLLFVSSCYETRGPLYFNLINNTNKLIYYGSSYSYPDITAKGISFIPKINSAYKVKPSQEQAQPISNFDYNPTMQIFIFDADVIENEPWDTIVKYNKFLKRYQFTRQELDNMGLKVIYDGK